MLTGPHQVFSMPGDLQRRANEQAQPMQAYQNGGAVKREETALEAAVELAQASNRDLGALADRVAGLLERLQGATADFEAAQAGHPIRDGKLHGLVGALEANGEIRRRLHEAVLRLERLL